MSGLAPGKRTIRVIDSHTAGEPTRVVVEGGPDLGGGSLAERRERFKREFDRYRSAVVNEPRGSDPVVGALLCEPVDRECAAGVIFFNNVGYLNMCGHGTIGLVVTLAHMGRIGVGVHRIETPVGVVSAELHADGRVNVGNVRSYRHRKDVAVEVPGLGVVRGDVAWGGNWFFLVGDEEAQRGVDRASSPGEGRDGGECFGAAQSGPEARSTARCGLDLKNIDRLTDVTWRIRQAVAKAGITGDDGGEIDHVELFGPAVGDADSRNFVLCPGKAYDRSPCGTGTSAKLACLFADGKLKPGQVWRQESIVGTVFEGWVQEVEGGVIPMIRGEAFVNAEATLVLDERDPFCWGIREA